MVDANAIEFMAKGFRQGVLGFAALSNLYDDGGDGENKYGEFGDYADTVLNEYNPELLDKIEDLLDNDPDIASRCGDLVAAHGDMLQGLIESGACSDWSQHGYDLAMDRFGAGVGFQDRRYPEAVAKELTDAAGSGEILIRTLPREGSIKDATDIEYELT